MGRYYAGGKLRSADTISIPGTRTLTGVGPETVWTGPDDQRDVPEGVQVAIVSDSAQDGVAGTGCLTMRIDYLDGSGVRQNETITMNGVVPVNSVATDMAAILAMTVMTFGSGAAAAGTIIATNLAATSTFEQVEPFEARAMSAVYKVPSGMVLHVTAIRASASQAAHVSLRSDTNPASGAVVTWAMYAWATVVAGAQPGSLVPLTPFGPFPAGSLVWIMAQDAAATVVRATIEGYLEPA